MAQSLVSRIGASPVWRAGLASAFILGLAGFAAGVMPQACRNGFVICQTDTGPTADALAPVVETQAVAEPSAEVVAALEPQAEPATNVTAVGAIDLAMVKREPASLTRNDLIAQTFAALDMGLTTNTGELTSRKVRTVSIGPDGMPVIEAAQPEAAPVVAQAEAAPVEVAEAEVSEPVVAPEEPAAEDEPAAEEEPASAVAYAPVRGGTAVVGAQGGNVRSLPKTRGSDVLFALAPGSDVTVVEMQKGWAKVVDESGRSGWIWDELLTRP